MRRGWKPLEPAGQMPARRIPETQSFEKMLSLLEIERSYIRRNCERGNNKDFDDANAGGFGALRRVHWAALYT